MTEKGNISIHADNILPIIKKWLYSEKDIFLRELVANSSDALTKLQKLSLVGEAGEIPEAKIAIAIDKDKGTLSITDTGIGLTADEIKRYINQVAFSGLQDFVEKYRDKEDSQQIIGHFGLGFYSAFMVAKKVEIDSLSFREGAMAAHWSCDGSTEFELSESNRKDIGTTITLHVADDAKEMLEQTMIAGILHKYCAFIRHPIFLDGNQINDTQPLWTKNPSQVKDEEYKEFFSKLFPLQPEPLFWIHLNVDYPFNLKGVLFFPKLDPNMDLTKGQVKLFCNQVYVDDNVKEMIPEFLTLLKGVIDCPDLPLNVSRSYLQSDPMVQRISSHIVKKVADKLSGMAKTERESYEKFFEDIQALIKFGMMRDNKFYDKMLPHVLYKTSTGKYQTLTEYHEANKDKLEEGQVLYTNDENSQGSYLKMLEDQGIGAVVTHPVIDAHFLPFLEMQSGGKTKFMRVDADVFKHLIDDQAGGSAIVDPTDNKTGREKLASLFEDKLKIDKLKVRVEALKSPQMPAMLLVDENMTRMQEMARMGAFADMATNPFAGMDTGESTLVVNEGNPAVQRMLDLSRGFGRDEEIQLIAEQIYDLALLQQGNFTKDQMSRFVERTAQICSLLGPSAADASGIPGGGVRTSDVASENGESPQ